MSNTIWAVSEGQYSDYRVIAVFATEELADEAVAAGMGEGTEDLPFYDKVPVPTLVLTISCEVPTPDQQTPRKGARQFFQQWENTRKQWEHDKETFPQPKVKQGRWGPNRLSYYGTDFDAVRHAFGDHKAQMQAHWEQIV